MKAAKGFEAFDKLPMNLKLTANEFAATWNSAPSAETIS